MKESEESNTNASVDVIENKEKKLKSAIVSIPKIDELEEVGDNIDIDKHKGKWVSFDIPEENVEHVCSGDGNGKGDDVNVSSEYSAVESYTTSDSMDKVESTESTGTAETVI